MLKTRITSLVFIAIVSISSKADSLPLKTHLHALAKSAAIPGLSFGWLKKGEAPVLITVGLADKQKQTVVKQDTIFEAASLSKPVLAYIVLRLAERGQLSLDQPLYQILENKRIANKQWAKLLTPRLVLSHQTGLPNWSRGDLSFEFEPGSRWRYSGEGYVYLQQVVEKVTGLSFQAVAEKEVFKPLNMQNSYFTWHENDKLTLAKGHDRAGQPEKRDIPTANAAASLHTTAADYLKFLGAWLNKNKLSSKSRKEAFDIAVTESRGEEPSIDMGWGLGWGIYGAGQSKIAWHWGDNGVFRAFVAMEPQSQSAFVYFANSQNGLAIAKQVSEKVFPGNKALFDWLGYGQADSPFWQAERKGYELAAKGKYLAARKSFEKVLEKYPDNQRLQNKIKWFAPYIDKPKNSLVLSKTMLDKIVGDYGDRKLFVEKGSLKYQRGKGKASVLTPFYDNIFKVAGMSWFRLEIVFDEHDNPVKLVGHYESGYRDESVKTGD